jgi:tRNA nucleotidyltransferase (CCA-adding enzyme)
MLAKKINDLPKPLADFIRWVGSLADEKGTGVYAVGGFVRDLLLGVNNLDLDLVVEGDGIKFASEIARRLNLKLTVHKRFGTATLLGLGGFKVDVASARQEVYEEPAALPIVSSGNIKDDLFRRDFTINAMAIGINKHTFGSLVDFYGGQKDLEKGLLRVLNKSSFIDDPTRILRAVRFEQRFDFKIEKMTLGWLKEAVRQRMLQRVQKHRLRDELVLIFKESAPLKSLRRLDRLCGFSYIAPSLRFRQAWRKQFEDIAKTILWFKDRFRHKRHLEPYIMYMSLFFYGLSLKDLRNTISEFAFHKGESSRMISLKENFPHRVSLVLKKNSRASRAYRRFKPLSYEVILLIKALCKDPLIQKSIEDFLFRHNDIFLYLKGKDLKQMGLKPGPPYKKILEALLYAKIDAKIKTKEDELRFLQKLLDKK